MDKLSCYDYSLPEELIAYRPVDKREHSKMLMLNKSTGEIILRKFSDIVEYLNAGDCLVLNNTKVIKGRLYGRKEKNGALIEAMLISPVPSQGKVWNCFLRPGKRVKPGTKIYVQDKKNSREPSEIFYTIVTVNSDGSYTIKFDCADFYQMLNKFGHIPLPPYIKREEEIADLERYQTVYSKINGAVAAPTAGLHFSDDILKQLTNKGVSQAELTLHVGAGTFKPVQDENILKHKMHSEKFMITKLCADLVNATKKNGKKILAAGTTSVRVLETQVRSDGTVMEGSGWTDIFIRPPYKIKVADMLLTNFHLPRSTLLMLVSAFAGLENVLRAYNFAIKEKMRFYSYGDCMLIV